MRARDHSSTAFFNKREIWRVQWIAAFLGALALACQVDSFSWTPGESGEEAARVKANTPEIPVGTILPVRLERTISAEHARAGDVIETRIMQEVPLPNRGKIRERSVVEGAILNVARDDNGRDVELTLRLDQVRQRGETFSVATSLRAIASNMEVHQAQMPLAGADEATRLTWANTIQIGGDERFGDGGRVRNRWRETVGKAVPGGVLVNVSANPEMGCEGPVGGDEHPQALWVFSADACGVYGMKSMQLVLNGERAPVGEIVLHFRKANMKLRAGAGILLRVVAKPE